MSRKDTTALLFVLGLAVGCKHPAPATLPPPQEQNSTWTKWSPVYEEVFSTKERCLSAPIERTFTVGQSPFGQRLLVSLESPRPLEMGYQIIVDGKERTTSTINTYPIKINGQEIPSPVIEDICQGSGPGIADPTPSYEPTPEKGDPTAEKNSGKSTGKAPNGKKPKESSKPKESTKTKEEPRPEIVLAEVTPYTSPPARDSYQRPNSVTYESTFLQITEPPVSICRSIKGRLGDEFISAGELLTPGSGVTVRIYRTNGTRDMGDVIFRVKLVEVVPKVSVAEYQAFLDSKLEEDIDTLMKDADACTARFNEYKKNPGSKITVAPPPPAPKKETQPKAPQKGSIWIPGSWRWTGADYTWDVGFWHIPEKEPEIVVAVKPSSNTPPPANTPAYTKETPASKDAPPPPTPSYEGESFIWVPGYWTWSSGVYVWVAGRWEAPPAPEMRWQVPRWEANVNVQVFVPGKWIKPKTAPAPKPKPTNPKPY